MAKTRSPNYPSLDLATALDAVRPVFKAENRNKFSRLVLAQHLGYTSLNGRALGKIGAIRAYGLIEGSGDNLRLSSDAITALAAPEDSAEQKTALANAAQAPTLFQEIGKEFEGVPSERNLHFWLVKRGFTSDAASKAVESYLATMRIVSGIDGSDNPTEVSRGSPPMQHQLSPAAERLLAMKPSEIKRPLLQEIFNLDEGPVTLTFPGDLSTASYEDLESYLKLFLRKAKRQVDQRRAEAEISGDPDEQP